MLALGITGACDILYPDTPTFSVNFVSNGGNEIAPLTVSLGKIPSLPDNPTREGYTFDGWYLDNETFNKSANNILESKITKAITVYAKWTLNNYTITFVTNGGRAVPAITVDSGTEIIEPEEPYKKGYTFNGWFTDNSTFSNAFLFPNLPNESVTLYAKWTINQYTITYNCNGGSTVAPITQNYHTRISAPINPTLLNYSFMGWYVDDETFIEVFTFSYMPAENLTLYAKWTLEQYTITFNNNGGSATVASITKAQGMVITAPENPLKERYTFEGWFTDNGTFINEYTFEVMPQLSFTLYAKWKWSNYSFEDGNDANWLNQYNTSSDEYAFLNEILRIVKSVKTDVLPDNGYYIIGTIAYSDYNLTLNEAINLFAYLHFSEYSYFWLSNNILSDNQYIYLLIDQAYSTYNSRRQTEDIISSTIENLAVQLNGMTTDIQKITAIYNFICNTVYYEFKSDGETPATRITAHNIVGVLDQNALTNSVCDGYSKAFSYICNMFGIKSILIGSVAMCHSWNCVKVNDVWYWMDVTFDDNTSSNDNFLKGNDSFLVTHYGINSYFVYPVISNDDYGV